MKLLKTYLNRIMKRILLILSVFLFCAATSKAQPGDKMEVIAQRLNELIAKRLDLSKSETERFSPVFLRYFKELRQTHQQYRTDRPMLQLKIAELRVAYRDRFKEVLLDEKRANRVFLIEKEFQERVKEEIKERREERRQNQVPRKSTQRFVD